VAMGDGYYGSCIVYIDLDGSATLDIEKVARLNRGNDRFFRGYNPIDNKEGGAARCGDGRRILRVVHRLHRFG